MADLTPDYRCPSKPANLLILSICLAGVIFWVHLPALSAKALLFDDEQYLTKNLLVQKPGWSSAKRFLAEVLKPSTVTGYYQPLTMISLMLDYPFAKSPFDVRPFHRTSLILHVANTVLIFLFLWRLFDSVRAFRRLFGNRQNEKAAALRSGPMGPAFMTAMLFGVHPLMVEPIPWVGERKTLLATFFALISLILFVRWVQSSSRGAYAGALTAFVLAMLSKPTVTPLPLLLLLLDVWPLRRWSRRAVLEKIPFLLLAALFAVITFLSQSRSAGIQLPQDYGPARIPLVLCHNIVFYLYKLVWPHDLSAHYPFPAPMDWSNSLMLAGVIGTGLWIAFLAASWRWTRAIAVGWLFFFLAILPTMQIIGFSNVIASDKYAYFPALGICLIVMALLIRCWNGSARIGIAGIVFLLTFAEARATRHYLAQWKDTETLYRHMIALAPNSAPLYNDLAADAVRRGLREQARAWFDRAVELEPNNPTWRNNRASNLYDLGLLDEAMSGYQDALRLAPDSADPANGLGIVLARKGRLDEAEQYFRRALSIKSDAPDVHSNLAGLYLLQGKNAEAAAEAREAVRLQPAGAEAHYHLGLANARQGALDQAQRQFTRAIRLRSDYVDARMSLAEVLMARGRWSDAADQFREVLRLHPDHAPARKGLATASARESAASGPGV